MTTIDAQIGLKIRTIRKGWGMSQIELAEKMGVSFQQIQKYEKGATRLSVLRLCQISEALGVNITTFFQEGDRAELVSGPTVEYGGECHGLSQLPDSEGATLLKLFRRIKNKKIREGILKQLRGIVELETKR